MTHIEIDHVFVLSDCGAPEADALVAAGFAEGSPNSHAGQGTACRRFFFENAMLEFLYATDLDTARAGAAARTHLAERWLGRESGASPFGLCFRPSHGVDPVPPFPSWTYGPRYLPGSTPSYEISQRSGRIEEPFAFYMPLFSRPDQSPPERMQPLDHACGARLVTRIELESPAPRIPDLDAPTMPPDLQLRCGHRQHMHIELDGGRHGRSLEFPRLPLSLSW